MLINVVYKRIESKQTGIGGCRMNVENMIIMILVAVVCTFFWRVLPFALLGGEKKLPKKVRYLGRILPPAIMAVLIVYCLRDVPTAFLDTGLAKIIAVAVVAVTYLWKNNTFISIILGTASYMFLLQLF